MAWHSSVMLGLSWTDFSVLGSQVLGQASAESCVLSEFVSLVTSASVSVLTTAVVRRISSSIPYQDCSWALQLSCSSSATSCFSHSWRRRASRALRMMMGGCSWWFQGFAPALSPTCGSPGWQMEAEPSWRSSLAHIWQSLVSRSGLLGFPMTCRVSKLLQEALPQKTWNFLEYTTKELSGALGCYEEI